MKRNVNLYLMDILNSIKLIESYTRKKGLDKFKKNRQNQDAVIRRLEIIGEASKQIPENIKKRYASVRWQGIGGIRDFLSHVYFGVNVERIWKIINQDIPKLKKEIQKILKDIKNEK